MKGDLGKDKHPERFPNNPEMDVISRIVFRRDELKKENQQLTKRIKELEKENEQLVVLSEDSVKVLQERVAKLEVGNQGGCFQCGRREFDGMILHTYDCKYSVMERQLAEKDALVEALKKIECVGREAGTNSRVAVMGNIARQAIAKAEGGE